MFEEKYERYTKQEIVRFNNFVIRELKKLKRKGFTIEPVRMKGSWMTFHIKKKRPETLDWFAPRSVSTTVNVIYKTASAPNHIFIDMVTYRHERFEYGYRTFTKFKKGFMRNVVSRYIEK